MKITRFLAVLSLPAFALVSVADAAITVNQASIKTGVITIIGSGALANSIITLDGGVATAKASANGSFSFPTGLYYVPSSCFIRLTSPGQADAVGLVTNCGPISLASVGAWNSASTYSLDNLATYQGSTWR